MAKTRMNADAQCLLCQDFKVRWNAWVEDSVSGAKVTFGSTLLLSDNPDEKGLTGAANNTVVFECIQLPVGAVLQAGNVIVKKTWTGGTATLAVGTAASPSMFVPATSIATPVGTSTAFGLATNALVGNLVPTPLRMTLVYTGNATAGEAVIRVTYTIDNRSTENA